MSLHVVDSPGDNPPLVFLNGGFATLRHWDGVVSRLSNRTIRFDARGRGRSAPSTDYSVAASVADVGEVIRSTGASNPILVGWSHGATLAVRYALEHPGSVAGLVLIDGAYPVAMFDEEGASKVRAQFRRLAWLMRVASVLRLSARLTAEESANVVLDMDKANAELDFAALKCPTTFVVATGPHSGATEDEMRTMRATVTKATDANDLVTVHATVPVNHVRVLSKAADTVVAAIGQVAKTV
jgi:pimeloyl-ACP methyl ester carboxylesterase